MTKIYNFSNNKKQVVFDGTLTEIELNSKSLTTHEEIAEYLKSQNLISTETTTIYARNLDLNLFEQVKNNMKWASYWHRINASKLENANSVCFITFIKEKNVIKLFTINKQEIGHLIRHSTVGHRDCYNFMIGEKLF